MRRPGPHGHLRGTRANLKPLVIDSHEPGGQLTLTARLVENFQGFPDSVVGPDLIENKRKQVQLASARSFTRAPSRRWI